jgi:WD40 repeat protein
VAGALWDFGRSAFLEEFDTGRQDETHPLGSIPGTDLVLLHHLAGEPNETSCQRRWLSVNTKRYYTLWHYDQRRLVAEFPHEGAWLQNFSLSSRGDFAVVHGNGSFSLRRITPLSAPTTCWPHRRGTTDVAFTPDGSIFATAGSDGVAKLWDAATRREIVALKGHLLSNIRALAMSPASRSLATTGGGKEGVRLWDVQTHQELVNLTLSTEGPGLTAIAFSRDGSKLIDQSALGIRAASLRERPLNWKQSAGRPTHPSKGNPYESIPDRAVRRVGGW